MTENPLYRRIYNSDNPLLQQRSWRPPSESYPQTNLNQNAAQDLRNLFGNFFTPNAAQNYSPQYRTPYQTMMPTYNSYQGMVISPEQQANNRFVQNEVAPPVLDYATQQAIQKGIMLAAGTKGLGALGRQYYPYAMATLAATRYGAPIVNGIEKVANSPVGKFVGRVADWIF